MIHPNPNTNKELIRQKICGLEERRKEKEQNISQCQMLIKSMENDVVSITGAILEFKKLAGEVE